MNRALIIISFLGALFICATPAPVSEGSDIDIYSFHVNSTVITRYAITVIRSRVANRLNESKEVHFEVKIPKNAFISKFRMNIDGKMYDGVVKQKEEAQQQYREAVSRGESAGIVSSVGRTLEEFKTSVTVAALSKVTFELTYEELLNRHLGKYELLINAQPKQPVSDFKIDVHIKEHPGLASLEVKGGLNSTAMPNAITSTQSESSQEAWVTFYPTREQQMKCCGENGLNGDLIITYDVKRTESNGELQMLNGYFVHYFAPSNIQRIPKNVVFVIDKSGSMGGRKMEQTQSAMLKILEDLAEDDSFGLITFDHFTTVWSPALHQATKGNIEKAKDFVKQIQAIGGTNINDGLLKGVDFITNFPRKGTASILILLTDGDPNFGEENPEIIRKNIKQAIGQKFPLYCLGFGNDVDFDFLRKMSLDNNGVGRKIYEDSDADLQLQGFYEEVATPLLSNVQLNYIGADNLTQVSFSQYYSGSEIVVAGQLTTNSLEAEVKALSKNSDVTYHDSLHPTNISDLHLQHEDFVQRLWAFLTVKQLLDKEMTLEGVEKTVIKKRILDLSLKYNFVTPLTSMVVTKPQAEETQIADKPKEAERQSPRFSAFAPVIAPGLAPGVAAGLAPGFPAAGYGHGVAAGLAPGFPAAGGVGTGYGQGVAAGLAPGFAAGVGAGYGQGFAAGTAPGFPAAGIAPGFPAAGVAPGYGQGVAAGIAPGFPAAGVAPVQNSPASSIFLYPVDPITYGVHDPSVNVRFLSAPYPESICYDIPIGVKLYLLTANHLGFLMTGEVSKNGFSQIAVYYKTEKLSISTSQIIFQNGLGYGQFFWGQEFLHNNPAGISMVLRPGVIQIYIGALTINIYLQRLNQDVFLWPEVINPIVMRGILGKRDFQYSVLSNSQIILRGQLVISIRRQARAYQNGVPFIVDCWFVPFNIAMQEELSYYTAQQV